jgi:hypothetical protein
MDGKENRRAPRHRHDSVMEIYDESGHLITGIGRLIDFSKVGVCFSTTKVLKTGEPLHARLRLLKEGVIEVAAHVVWMKKRPNVFLYGLAFDDVKNVTP